MKYAAVIFYLFGTLIDKFSLREGTKVLEQIASVLSVSSDDFIQLYFSTYNEGALGVFNNTEAKFEYICQKIGVRPKYTQTKLAAQIHLDYTRRSITPRPDSTEVLSHLKSSGYKTGLISDCSDVVAKVWQNTPFTSLIDVAVFSCLVGFTKPDSRIYQVVAEQLKVEPQSCLYIGDGGSQELTGAAQVGMHPVLIRVPDEDITDMYRLDAERESWDGPAISSLKEVLTLIK